MFVEVIVYGGGTLIAGLAGIYAYTIKREKNDNAALGYTEEKISMEVAIEKANSSVAAKVENPTVEDELYRLAKIAMVTGYFDYYKLEKPEPNYHLNGVSYDFKEYRHTMRKWEQAITNAHVYDVTLVDFMEKRYMKINREHEIEMLVYKYSYIWDTYEQIIKEAREFKTTLSKEVKQEIHNGITQFITDYSELEYRINKHQKQLKEEMDAATNESFMKRLQLERDYINKIRNKEEFDLSLEKL